MQEIDKVRTKAAVERKDYRYAYNLEQNPLIV